MKDLTINRNLKLFLAGFTIIGAVAAGIIYILIMPTANYHFHQVIVNFYHGGAVDFSADVTGLVRGLGVVALACIVLGLLVGSAIRLGRAETLSESRESHFAPNAKIDVALLKSGLVSGIATEEGVRFELTDRGRQFMQEYEKTERDLRGRTPKIIGT